LDWQQRVNAAFKRVLHADIAVMNVPSNGEAHFFSEEIDPDALRAYPDALFPLGKKFGAWQRAADLSVATRPMIWGDHYGAYRRSGYYNDFVKPRRAFGALVLSVLLPGSEDASADSVAQVVVHRDDPSRADFDEHALQLGRWLFPAFRSAMMLHERFTAQRSDFLTLCDRADCGVLLCDATGSRLHANAVLRRFLAEDPEGEAIQTFVDQFVQNAAELRSEMEDTSLALPSPPESTVRTGLGTYRLNAYLSSGAVLDPTVRIVITIHRQRSSVAPAPDLMDRFDLTKQQARTAQLLALRLTNDEVAQILVISPHTARRHTEQVLAKMEVNSRFEVRALLRDLADSDSG
jgi:DNA-binding CsgD family transcriptional regulator